MRSRPHGKHFFFNEVEVNDLTRKAKKTGLSEAALVRMLLRGYAPKEKPDEQFYAAMQDLSAIHNSVKALVRMVACTNTIDSSLLEREAESWCTFRMEVKRRFLEPERLKSDGGH